MKKTLNEKGISNELRGQSAFFPKPFPPSASVEEASGEEGSRSERPKDATNVRTGERPIQRSNERTMLRRKIRHTFDIYQDQLLSLRELALRREVLSGERVLLGDLVQAALDMFITKERNNDATNE